MSPSDTKKPLRSIPWRGGWLVQITLGYVNFMALGPETDLEGDFDASCQSQISVFGR